MLFCEFNQAASSFIEFGSMSNMERSGVLGIGLTGLKRVRAPQEAQRRRGSPP